MIKVAFYDKPLLFTGATFREKHVSHHRAVLNKLLNTFEFIKAVSVSVLDMIKVTFYDKPLIFIGTTFDYSFINALSAKIPTFQH